MANHRSPQVAARLLDGVSDCMCLALALDPELVDVKHGSGPLLGARCRAHDLHLIWSLLVHSDFPDVSALDPRLAYADLDIADDLLADLVLAALVHVLRV